MFFSDVIFSPEDLICSLSWIAPSNAVGNLSYAVISI